MTTRRGPSGDELFAIVEEYASFGDHRTGSECDHRTSAWMATQLRTRGFDVEERLVPFDHTVATSSLLADGEPIAHLVVPGEWTGSISTDDPHVESIDPKFGGFAEVLDGHATRARAAGATAAIFATDHPEGDLVAINREMDGGSGIPVVLVAGRDLQRLEHSTVRLDIDARVEPGLTTNVVATNGLPGPPLVLATPLNGWFRAAGERGTGIAVLLALTELLEHLPLVVVATAGHELGFFGAYRWVEETNLEPRGVVVIGASAAVEADTEHGRELARTRFAMTTIDSAAAAPLEAPLATINLPLRSEVTSFSAGEGQAFSRLGVPTFAFTGMGIDFHTPSDTPERATSPAALSKVADAIAETIEHFVAAI